MQAENESLGRASLSSAIIGVALPATLAIVATIALPHDERLKERSYALCLLMLLALEIIAVACGFQARHTLTGRAGLIVSASFVTLALIWSAISIAPEAQTTAVIHVDKDRIPVGPVNRK